MSTVLFPLLNSCMTSSKTLSKAERQECPPLNPCWVGFKCPLEIRKVTIYLRITLSNTLIITDVREIGRLLLGTVLSPDLNPVPTTPACTWWNRPEEDLSSGKSESTHPSRTVVKSIEVFYGVESVVRGNADSLLN